MGDDAVGRPPIWAGRCKWVEERIEDFVTTAQGRDNVTRARLALDADGRFLALEADTIANLGAYMSGGGPGSSTNAPANAMGSGYVIPAIFMDVRGAFTNTVPIDAYRGAGKPEANYLMERLIDAAARQCGFDPIELRRRNLMREFPYRKALGTVVDCGRFAANLDDAVIAADHAGFAARRAATEQTGRLRGIGVTCFMETARGAPNEGAEIPLRTGRHGLGAGRHAIQRQGHETAYPQIAADLLGLPIGDVPLHAGGYGESARRQRTWRRTVDAHGWRRAVQGRRAMLAKGRAMPRDCCRPRQVVFADGRFSVQGEPDRSIDLPALARAARDPANVPDGMEAGLDTMSGTCWISSPFQMAAISRKWRSIPRPAW